MNADNIKYDIEYAKHQRAGSEIDGAAIDFIGVYRRSSAANSCS
jgi:hypothetical protein